MPVARSKTKQNLAYAALRQLVTSAAFKPGDQLPPLRQLAAQSNTNLNAVYIAIRRLEHEKLVVTHHGKGVFIAPIAPRMRNVLLLTRIQGHLWSEITQHFIQQFTANPQDRLIIEHVPDERSGQLPAFRQKLKSLIENGIDTVIFNGMHENNLHLVFDDLPPATRKLCFLSRASIPGKNVGGVVSDWYHGGHIAVHHLIDIGARNIVHILPAQTGQINEINRGGQAVVDQYAASIQFSRFLCPNFATNSLDKTRQLLKQFPEVDGILAYGDFVAVPLIRSLQELGKRVPQDIAVAGYYDTPWVEFSSPAITSVNLSCQDMIDQVLAMYHAGDFQSQHSVHPKLVVRDSTRR